MRRGPRHPGPWLLTFADLAALLLAFFVLTFSMSRLDVERWRRFSAVWPGQTAAAPRALEPSRRDHSAPSAAREPAVGKAGYLARVLDQRLAALGRPFALRASARSGAVTLRFAAALLADRSETAAAVAAPVRAILLPVLSEVVEMRLLAPIDAALPLAEQLRALRRFVETAGERFGRPPTTALAADPHLPAELVILP